MTDDTTPAPADDAAAELERAVVPAIEHTTVPAVFAAICEVMNAVGAVGKGKTSDHGNFKFRGVDDAMNALGPVLRSHCLFVTPRLVKFERTRLETKGGGGLMNTVVEVEYDFISGADGSKHTVGPIPGEGMDTGDKSTAKAMSVAMRTMLWQVFMVPTEDRDPDHDVYEVANTSAPAAHASNASRSPRSRPEDVDPWANSNPDLVKYYTGAIDASGNEESLKFIWGEVVTESESGKLAGVDRADLSIKIKRRLAAIPQDRAAEAPQA